MAENVFAGTGPGRTDRVRRAIGTQLQAHGIPAGTLPELWNVERPEVLREVHRGYWRRARRFSLPTPSVGTPAREGGWPRRSPSRAQPHRVAWPARWPATVRGVGGSMGPPAPDGALGDLTVRRLRRFIASRRLSSPRRAWTCFLVETQQDIDEACAIVRAARPSAASTAACPSSALLPLTPAVAP
jgi:5-methyltetrahydrofolate--homocysteine methyltransferase